MKNVFRKAAIVAASAIACTVLLHGQQPASLGPQVGSAMPPALRAQKDAYLQQVLNIALGHLNNSFKSDIKNVTTRDLSNGAFYTLQCSGDAVTAEVLLRKLFSVQNMDKDSADFGNIQWKVDDPTVRDANAIEFAMQPMGAIFTGYGSKFSTGFKKDAAPHLQAALVALSNHHVPVSYTNIYLMNTMNTLELAEYLKDEAALARGQQQWQKWRAYTTQNNVHEFLSPTYYGVDLGDLTLGYRYVADPVIHKQIGATLDYFWQDISANFLLPAKRMASPHSRDYNFLHGWGGIDFYLYAEGVFDDQDKDKLTDVFLEKADAIENDRPGGYHPSPEVLRMMTVPYRTVQQRWDENTAHYRYVYITPEYALGTTDGSYDPQDKMFGADYLASQPVITTSLVVDTLDQPYGLAQFLDPSGHPKPLHAPTNLSSVQEKNTALLVLDLNPSREAKDKALATNLLLPSTADNVLLDRKPVHVSSALDLPAHIGSVVAVRQDHACFAAKLWYADALQGAPPSLRLKADDLGIKHGAFRFVVYHGHVDPQKSKADHLHVSVLVAMEKCSSEDDLMHLEVLLEHADVAATPGDGSWMGTAKIGDLHLSLTEDTQKRLPLERIVDGKAMETPPLTVNGKAVPLE